MSSEQMVTAQIILAEPTSNAVALGPVGTTPVLPGSLVFLSGASSSQRTTLREAPVETEHPVDQEAAATIHALQLRLAQVEAEANQAVAATQDAAQQHAASV